ncbi:peptidyl-prolyl cis-trans isomerase-like 4 [Lineus longissimus]|uniref:peptidyl-prolyl cis-trans isomerase-like 4 n=1 Tax=Lineus longissimus TaxID=88925 RepID=UPI002B4D673A
MAVILETSLGDITVDMYSDERPRCCLNFLKLCKIKYYNFCLFHSVQHNLVAQTGDPTGTGRGGASMFEKLYGDQARYFEMETKPRIKHKKRGLISMVNNGHDMHGSQFFVTLGDDLDYLDGVHTVFGEVAEGFDVLDQINEAIVDKENHQPYIDIRIYHTVILDDPFDDPDDLIVPDRSPQLTKEQLESGRIGVDEEIDDTKGKTVEEIEEAEKEKEAKANAQFLEIIGDLPTVDVQAPDTVLFVCKLNPVTTDEDLEIIFSRFGKILSCEVIKDQKSGESLQYGFIEFEKPSECENAYFKMDNVLIDDRRIHVDFSQSVAKVKWKGKGKGVEHPNEQKEYKRPEYAVKDKSHRGENYDLVFEPREESDSLKGNKKKKKKHKHKGSRSRSSSKEKHKKKSKHSKKSSSRSNSPPKGSKRSSIISPKRLKRSISRSPTRLEKSKRVRSRSPLERSPSPSSKERRKEKHWRHDRSRSRERDSYEKKDKYRDKREQSRDHERSREWDYERSRDSDRPQVKDKRRERDSR